jgi:hypothetical protein
MLNSMSDYFGHYLWVSCDRSEKYTRRLIRDRSALFPLLHGAQTKPEALSEISLGAV